MINLIRKSETEIHFQVIDPHYKLTYKRILSIPKRDRNVVGKTWIVKNPWNYANIPEIHDALRQLKFA